MSLGHLLRETRNVLRAAFADPHIPRFNPASIMVTPGSKWVYPYAGQWFISVYGIEWRPGSSPDQDLGLDEVYGMACLVTARSPSTALDRQGDELYIKAVLGMESVIRTINAAIHKNTATLLTSVNEALEAEAENLGREYDPVVEPFRWAGADPFPRVVDSRHFVPDETRVTPNAGLVMETRFRGARRLSAFNRME